MTLAALGCADLADPATRHRLQDGLDTSVAELGIPGAIVIVRRADGVEWSGVSGISESSAVPNEACPAWRGTPMETAMAFRVGSITKTFTATLILLLAEDGLLSLDDALDAWLPGVVPNSATITVRQLLNMTSGVHEYIDGDLIKETIANPFKQWTPAELVARANAHAPSFAPGEGYEYSNTNYVLLGMLAEAAAGESYAGLVASRITGPLGLADTSVPTGPAMADDHAHGYEYLSFDPYYRWVEFTETDPSWAWAAGGMVATAEDLVPWLEAFANGTLLSAESRAVMFTYTDRGDGSYYGLGVHSVSGAVGHEGHYWGYNSAMFLYKDHYFAVLTNGVSEKEPDPALALFVNAAGVLAL